MHHLRPSVLFPRDYKTRRRSHGQRALGVEEAELACRKKMKGNVEEKPAKGKRINIEDQGQEPWVPSLLDAQEPAKYYKRIRCPKIWVMEEQERARAKRETTAEMRKKKAARSRHGCVC